MKKITLTIATILVTVLIYSCGNEKNETKHEQTEKVEATDSHDHVENGLMLDNGKLWIANPETTEGVQHMITIMNSFTDKDDVEAYEQLTENLKLEFTMIFQKCTMQGEAHNQLHNFLIPIKHLFETLGSKNIKECQSSFDNLDKHLDEYKKYFK
jgi:hypothetical protein